MPSISIKVPKGAYPDETRNALVRNILAAAAEAEQMSLDPKSLALTWITVEEIEIGQWTCGAVDVSADVLTCFAMIHVPAGVLDDASRSRYLRLIHGAFQESRPPSDTRRLATSVILQDVDDGSWGGSGVVMRLPALAKLANYAHLAHLAAPN